MSKTKAFLADQPLTPPVFYILLALALKQRHGYDIMKQVREDSKNQVILGPGTLYGAIKRMLEAKLITETGRHGRRRYYSLTAKGRSIFTKEMNRYFRAVEVARKHKLLVNVSLINAYV